MKLTLIIDAAIILLVSYYIMKKRLHLFENIFILMILEFLVTSYCAILYINLDVWTIANDTELFIIFRVYETIIYPFIWLSYFNLQPFFKSALSKWIWTGLFVGIQSVVERWLVEWDVITYKGWPFWLSFILQTLIVLIVHLALAWYRNLMRKEGIPE
ncbi:hypothetical protein PH210_25880 [Paenibacillus sp. BSR1-1]|uniref:hypothetical protein n=1 Tax=Paenibacillus sp. BSR1-1 TaxID=3020845 RepID=UPI0025B1FD1E|nr:hypothetical protein [Paenibacillus sp. BSR1-1]MDN3019599.1 hypothetical protein [Paenibacillus sp. BSR1-1]